MLGLEDYHEASDHPLNCCYCYCYCCSKIGVITYQEPFNASTAFRRMIHANKMIICVCASIHERTGILVIPEVVELYMGYRSKY